MSVFKTLNEKYESLANEANQEAGKEFLKSLGTSVIASIALFLYTKHVGKWMYNVGKSETLEDISNKCERLDGLNDYLNK